MKHVSETTHSATRGNTLETYRGWRNSANGEDPIDIVRDLAAHLPNV